MSNSNRFQPNDVVCGVGNFTNHGNVVLNELVEECIPVFYEYETSKEDKQMLVENIVDSMATLGGRFMDNKTGKEITREEAMKKVHKKIINGKRKQRLREKKTAEKTEEEDAPPPPKKAKPKPAPVALVIPIAPKVPPPPAVASLFGINKILVAKNRLLRGSMDEKHALTLLQGLPFGNEDAKKQAAQLLLKQLQKERAQLKEWATYELKTLMVQQAIEVDLIPQPKKGASMEDSFNDIVTAWVKDGSPPNQQKLNTVLYGPFGQTYGTNEHSPWILAKQHEYMQQQNLMYTKENVVDPTLPQQKLKSRVSRTGYVYDLISHERNILNQRIKAQGSKSHGHWVDGSLCTPKKRAAATGSDADGADNNPPKKKRGRPRKEKPKTVPEAQEDESDDESIPIAQLKQKQQQAQQVKKAPPSTTEEGPAPAAPATTSTAPTLVPAGTKQETTITPKQEEMPVPTMAAIGAATPQDKTKKIKIITARGVEIPTLIDKSVERFLQQQAQPFQATPSAQVTNNILRQTRSSQEQSGEQMAELSMAQKVEQALEFLRTSIREKVEQASIRVKVERAQEVMSTTIREKVEQASIRQKVEQVLDLTSKWTDIQKAGAAVGGLCLVWALVSMIRR